MGPYLLDTSVVLWAVAEPKLLSSAARRAIRTGPVLISVVTYWEVVIKARKGLLTLSDPVTWWDRVIEQLKADILSIRADHVGALSALPEKHKDPFDRMLIAQATSEGIALVTKDTHVRSYPIRTLW